ncbi:MAG TPA: sugar ABC transporter substrate-binding protein, partial [Actinoplanes sp.]|nr:sugar ABC transporter substrate-binding protein [Actinoplanes sp.]
MRKGLFALAAVGLLATGGTAACGNNSSSTGSSGSTSSVGKVGIILPDTASSQRWGTDDPKFLKQAFDAAGVPVDIQ